MHIMIISLLYFKKFLFLYMILKILLKEFF